MEANNEEVAMAQRDKAPVKLWLPAVAFFLAAVVVAEEKTDTDQRIITFHNDPYVTADREKKEVRIKAALSPDLRAVRAILEFLLISGVYRQETKEWEYDRGYESVFVTNAQPATIQAALLLVGFRPGALPQPAPEGLIKDNTERIGDATKVAAEGERPKAPMMDIMVEWNENGTLRCERVEIFLFDRRAGKIVANTPWAYTGSYFLTNDKNEKVMAADLTRVIAAVFYDESALINLPYYTENPYGGPGMGLEVFADALPPYFHQEKEIIEGVKRVKIKIPQQREVSLVLRASELPPPSVSLPKTEEKEKSAPANASDTRALP